MKLKKMLILTLLAYAVFTSACVYIVLPEGLEAPQAVDPSAKPKDWSGFVTNVVTSDAGNLHIDIAIRNQTGEWSTMRAVEEKAALLISGDGKTTNCSTVFVSTGGHRLAPGFQMRGYTTGKKADQTTQLLYVECAGVTQSDGAKLTIDYVSFQGELDDYKPEANKITGKLELDLNEVATDLIFPVAEVVDGLIQASGVGITGLSDNVVTLLDAQRNETGFEFTWQNFNPTKFALKTHIGTPPVIGADGVIYGAYEILDMASVPITPAAENMQWTTQVIAPQDVTGFYILLSVESKKPRTYLNYAIDISDK